MNLMSNHITIGTWNLCLGLPNKKDIVIDILDLNKVDICCLQETEISNGFPENILSCGGYKLELEINSSKKRAGIYLRNDLKYKRRNDFEKEDFHIVIVDVYTCIKICIIKYGHLKIISKFDKC